MKNMIMSAAVAVLGCLGICQPASAAMKMEMDSGYGYEYGKASGWEWTSLWCETDHDFGGDENPWAFEDMRYPGIIDCANGAVTTAYSESEGGKATATGSAQLVPYEVDGNITKAWLYTALKPKGRDSFGVLLFLSIDTSNGNVYGDDVVVEDYLLEVDD